MLLLLDFNKHSTMVKIVQFLWNLLFEEREIEGFKKKDKSGGRSFSQSLKKMRMRQYL